MAMNRNMTMEEKEVRDYAQKQMERAEQWENILFTEEQKEQVLEYAAMTGDDYDIRKMIRDLADAVRSSDEEKVDEILRDAREEILNESIDDLTVQFEENGQTIVNELDKVVLSKGLWTTILFRYQVWQPEKNAFGPDMFVIRRYKKSGGEYRQQSKFTISSAEQARKIVDALSGWIN